MAKKKVDTKEVKKEEETKIDFSDKTIANCYEGLVVLDMKLTQLLDIMQKMYDLAEAKRTGTMSIN